MQDHILVVDDDRQLTSFLERFLGKLGYLVTCVASGAQMRGAIAHRDFDLIVMDVGLPDCDGFELMRELRRGSRTPVVMLTARDDIFDRIVGLELGADDYLGKPFEPRELAARIKSVLRRVTPAETAALNALPPVQRLTFAGLTLDLLARTLVRDGSDEPIRLTSAEFALIRALAQHAGEVLSRERILNLIYGTTASITDRAIDTHMARLRRKIVTAPDTAPIIKTIHGTGYVLAAAVAEL